MSFPVGLLPENALPPPDMQRLKDRHLVLFLEYASTLELYDKIGMLDRELALYRRLLGHFGRITIATWSRGGDEQFRERLGGISLVHNRQGWSWPVWMAWLFATFPYVFPGSCIVKTNQLSGAQHILKLDRNQLFDTVE